MLGGGDPLEEPAVDELAAEADLDPHARLGRRVEVGGDEVVEGPVEVWQRHVGANARDRQP